MQGQDQVQGRRDTGQREYESKCEVCHGHAGKGNGPYVEYLKTPASDLTALKKNNGGVFPVDRVISIIDGREAVKGHGAREMPIWGRQYSSETVEAAEYYVDVPYDQEMYIRSRILALVDYLDRLQGR
ncbi:MAG: c-type cytochrome [Rhodoferax sp.]|uniref:c-type cytochrome n=1 Tax=Rhodoferax sp. TaxID=50421 RepID=UPI00301790FB